MRRFQRTSMLLSLLAGCGGTNVWLGTGGSEPGPVEMDAGGLCIINDDSLCGVPCGGQEGTSCPLTSGRLASCNVGIWVCDGTSSTDAGGVLEAEGPVEMDAGPTPPATVPSAGLDCFFTTGVLACNTSCRPDEEGARCVNRGIMATCGAGIWVCDAVLDQ